jgi:hypothetical protein
MQDEIKTADDYILDWRLNDQEISNLNWRQQQEYKLAVNLVDSGKTDEGLKMLETLGFMVVPRCCHNLTRLMLLKPHQALCINRILQTKDGRKIGNAIITGIKQVEHKDGVFKPLFSVRTDYGSKQSFYAEEIAHLFYLGELATDDHKHFIFQFTPKNLLTNLDKLGPWSAYGLAREALKYYYPSFYDLDGHCEISKELELVKSLGCEDWDDVVAKYHKEVGYTAADGVFETGAVNGF